MKQGNYSKVGGKKGAPAYRTPSSFRYRKHLKVTKLKNPKHQNLNKFQNQNPKSQAF